MHCIASKKVMLGPLRLSYNANWKTWQLRLHCNLRQFDATQPLSALYNLVACAKFELAQLIRCRLRAFFPADTLRYAVTMNFDPVPFTNDRCT